MGLYQDHILPHLINLAMRKAELTKPIELLNRLSLVSGRPPKLTPTGILRLKRRAADVEM